VGTGRTNSVESDERGPPLFFLGAAPSVPQTAADVDLAVEGIPLDRLLDADVEVHEALRAPTDLVSREENPTLYDIVISYGKVLYEQG